MLRSFTLFTALAGMLFAVAGTANGLPGAQRISAVQPPAESLPVADRILVLKGERRLQLLRRGQVLREYRIALGLNPVGHKERSGDFRTPEGSYYLSRRNANGPPPTWARPSTGWRAAPSVPWPPRTCGATTMPSHATSACRCCAG